VVESGQERSKGEFAKTLFRDVRHWDSKRGEDGRSEGFAGAGTRYEVIEAVARIGMSFDGRGGEINDPCLRDPRCGVERQFRASVVGKGRIGDLNDEQNVRERGPEIALSPPR